MSKENLLKTYLNSTYYRTAADLQKLRQTNDGSGTANERYSALINKVLASAFKPHHKGVNPQG